MGNICQAKNIRSKVIPSPSAKHSKDSTDYSKSTINNDKKNSEVVIHSPCIRSNPSQSPTRRRSTFKHTSVINLRRNSEGTKMLNHYELQHVLGVGSYGKVRLAIKRRVGGEEKFAIKLFKKNLLLRKKEFTKDRDGNIMFKDAMEDVKREIAIMKKLFHPNIIKLFEVIDNPKHEKLYMVLEYAEGGQLIDWSEEDGRFVINQFSYVEENYYPEDFLRKVFRDCLKGLNYLHTNGVIHRDLKPQNILLDNYGNAKIADFGVSAVKDKNEEILLNTKGTFQFMAPELFTRKNVKSITGKGVDIWGIGVTLYCLIFLELPFKGDNIEELIKSITKQKLKFPQSRKLSAPLVDLLKKILEKNHEHRLSLEKIIQHPWVNLDYPKCLSDEIEETKEEYSIQDVSDKEVDNALLPIERVVFLKNFIKKIKTHMSSKLSDSSLSINSPVKYQSPGKGSAAIIKEDFNEHFTLSKKNTFVFEDVNAENKKINNEVL